MTEQIKPDRGSKTDFFDAILTKDLSKRQMSILLLIYRATYGCGQWTGLFQPSDFIACGVYPNAVMPELDYLDKARVISVKQIDLDTHREKYLEIGINPDYGKWAVAPIKGGDSEAIQKVVTRNYQEPSRKRPVKKPVPFKESNPDLYVGLPRPEKEIIDIYEQLIPERPFTYQDLVKLKVLLQAVYPGQIKTAMTAYFKNYGDAFRSMGFEYLVEPLEAGAFGKRTTRAKKETKHETKPGYNSLYAEV